MRRDSEFVNWFFRSYGAAGAKPRDVRAENPETTELSSQFGGFWVLMSRCSASAPYCSWMYNGTGHRRRIDSRLVGGLSLRDLENCFQPANCTGSFLM